MLTSAGLREIGLSGKIRIQIRPPRLIWRVIARRAASFSREFKRPRPIDFKPYSPKDTAVPRLATPVLRPLCSLRNFLRLGCSISFTCKSIYSADLEAPSAVESAALRAAGRRAEDKR